MKENTDFKENTTSMTAILVFLALALLTTSSVAAQSILMDGDGSDWVGLTGVKCMVDETGEIDTEQTLYFDNGYDIADFCVYYDMSNDTLYFKINVAGVPGDTDGDGDPNDTSDSGKPDNYEVGYGETYAARLDLDGDCNIDYKLEYSNNNVAMKDYTTGDVVAGTAVGSIGSTPYTDTVVEMSFSPAHNIPGFGDCNTDFKSQGWAGNEHDGLGEDNTSKFSVNKAPVSIPVAGNVCYCTNTTFDGSASHDPDGTIVLYEWDFGDEDTNTGATTGHHYGAVGDYTVTLTVTDDYGFKCSNTTTVWVYENPAANFTATEVCFCTNTTFYDTTTGGTAQYTYAWDFDGDGTIDSTEANPSHHYPAHGSHTVTLNVTDARGCSDEITRSVYVVHDPVAVARANRSHVEAPGGWVLFNGIDSVCDMNTTQPNSLNYIWEIHGSTYTDDGEGVLLYLSGNTTANLTVRDMYDCTDTADVTVTYLQHPPVAKFDFSGTGCKVGILNASESYDPDGYITAYEWDLNNDGIYGDKNGTICTFGPVPVPPEDYWIGLKVTDDAGASNTTRKQIMMTGNPHAVAEANGGTGSIQLSEGGEWVVFDGTNSTAYPGTEIVDASCTWNISGVGTYSGRGPLSPVFIDRDTTATLRVVANNTCTDVSRVKVLMPPTEDVPILTPAGMIALIGMLCIASAGRIARKGRRS